jgi:flagellar hook-basal body complex protein FliE
MSIDAIQGLGEVAASRPIQNIDKPEPNVFLDLIANSLSNVNGSLRLAETTLMDMALDKPVSSHEVMLIMASAKKDLSLVVEVRNKLLESYQELMRMQV